MKDKKVMFMVQSAAIAAVYVVLTTVFAPISFGEIQIRFAEALTILPYFTPAAIPGLFIGCIIGNLTGGAIPLDILFGSLATLIGALGSYSLRRYKYLVPISPIVANTIIVPYVLYYGYGLTLPIPLLMLSIGIGEVISCGVLGMIVLFALDKHKHTIFNNMAA